mmetsp:Transcript_17401/g.43794  ORF Transcript_17401/g.43794 Transcript_17401/m.43794 type:complete len:264 (+) Transcript_17401:2-793(+)
MAIFSRFSRPLIDAGNSSVLTATVVPRHTPLYTRPNVPSPSRSVSAIWSLRVCGVLTAAVARLRRMLSIWASVAIDLLAIEAAMPDMLAAELVRSLAAAAPPPHIPPAPSDVMPGTASCSSPAATPLALPEPLELLLVPGAARAAGCMPMMMSVGSVLLSPACANAPGPLRAAFPSPAARLFRARAHRPKPAATARTAAPPTATGTAIAAAGTSFFPPPSPLLILAAVGGGRGGGGKGSGSTQIAGRVGMGSLWLNQRMSTLT